MVHIFTARTKQNAKIGGLIALCFLLTVVEASATGTGLPWDGPIDKITKGLSGPVAFLFAMGGMIVLGIRWIFGGEMGSLTRGLLTTISGIALLVFAIDWVAGLFGITSALIAQ